MRTCSDPVPKSGGSFCQGPDQDYQLCTDGMCRDAAVYRNPGNVHNNEQSVHKDTHLIHSSQGKVLL